MVLIVNAAAEDTIPHVNVVAIMNNISLKYIPYNNYLQYLYSVDYSLHAKNILLTPPT